MGDVPPVCFASRLSNAIGDVASSSASRACSVSKLLEPHSDAPPVRQACRRLVLHRDLRDPARCIAAL
jgi:hypothetical protein